MENTVLLIVDMQTALVESQPYQIDQVITNIQKLKEAAQCSGLETVYVQHDGGKDDELESGQAGWQIVSSLAPCNHEIIIEKHFNSAFKDNILDDYLKSQQIEKIILVGMQSEYCINATCLSAFDLGYTLYIPELCTTTFDNEYLSGQKLCEYYEKKIWNQRFATVLSVDKMIDMIYTDE